MKKMCKNFILVSLIVFCMLTPSALAWSSNVHKIITTGAIKHLPQPLYDFFSRNSTTVINASAIEPSPSYTHYIDIDYYPEFAAGTFPHDITVLIAAYGQSTVEDKGTGPWALETAQNELTTLMQSATTTQDWIDLLATAGTLSHYTEDLHNPMHLTVNYNPNNGLHSRYESRMTSYHSAELAPFANPFGCVYLSSVIDTVFSQIDIAYAYNDDILAADLAAYDLDSRYSTTYYNSMWSTCGTFTIQLLQAASEQLASEWYTAWIDAGSPNLPCYYTLEGDLNDDCAVNFLDLTILVQQWLDTCSADTWCEDADTNQSNEVDLADYITVASNWLIDCYETPGNAACVE